MKHILVGVDGSDASKKAARFAAQLAKDTGARLTLLLVLDAPAAIPIGALDAYVFRPTRSSPESLAEAKKLLEEIPHELPRAQVEQRVEIGHPAEVLLDQARAVGADLVVVGARGLGAGKRWLLGSVSDRVVRHADRPVTVVR